MTKLELDLHRIIYSNSPAENSASQTSENKSKCKDKLVAELIKYMGKK
tara:strand:- start:568 stop:711 length:144 start_codon:yes stop_codon:yes gene_type:complete